MKPRSLIAIRKRVRATVLAAGWNASKWQIVEHELVDDDGFVDDDVRSLAISAIFGGKRFFAAFGISIELSDSDDSDTESIIAFCAASLTETTLRFLSVEFPQHHETRQANAA